MQHVEEVKQLILDSVDRNMRRSMIELTCVEAGVSSIIDASEQERQIKEISESVNKAFDVVLADLHTYWS